MDLVQTITGRQIVEVFADLRTVFPVRHRPKGEVETFSAKTATHQETEAIDIETEDMGAVLLRFDNGARGVLWVSQLTAGRKNCLRYEIAGKENAIWFDGERPNELWIGHRNQPNEHLFKDASMMDPMVSRYIDYPGGHNEGYPDSFKMCFRAFYDYIVAGDFSATPFFPTFEEGHREILLCEAILRSHDEQRWVKVAE
jgi:predicted dehydrogenase